MSIKSLSHLGTLSFNEGLLGFKISKKGGEYRIGDHLLFYPCINIDKYWVSDTDERFLKHIFYDLYEFTFMAIDKYGHECADPEEHDRKKDVYHYLIEIMPGFNVLHFNWLKKADKYLKVGTLYRGFGRLNNCGDPSIENSKIDPEAVRRIRCQGVLDKLRINGLCRDCDEYLSPKMKKTLIAWGYDDVLRSVGYPEDMSKFRAIISKYQVDDEPILESTGQNKALDSLVYTIKMA
jgi:hypothetical protein